MSDIVRELRDDHRNMSRLLNVLEWQTALLQSDQRADYLLMEDVLHYMIHYADDYHHVREDAVFDAVAARDQACRAAADRLRLDHVRLAEKSRELYQIVQRIARDDIVPRDTLIASALDYITSQRAHMRYEENTLFNRTEQLFSNADREALSAELKDRDDPLFSHQVAERYRQRYAQLTGGDT